MKISFVIALKNRIHLKYNDKGITGTLNLLGNNLKSIRNIVKNDDNWEFIIVDFASTDANVNEFLKNNLNHPSLSYKLITLNEQFNKGKGLNIGIKNASHDIIFCYDADMMIHTYELFNDIQTFVINQNMAFFPICWSYSNPRHTAGWRRDTGTGNVIYNKNDVVKYIEKTVWGQEDDINYAHFKKLNKAVRKFYNDKFVHQWHPATDWHK